MTNQPYPVESMSHQIKYLAATLTLTAIFACVPSRVDAADLGALQAKWIVTKTNQEGIAYSQVIENVKEQLTFQILNADSKPQLVSTGTIQTSRAGLFDVLTIGNVRTGKSLVE